MTLETNPPRATGKGCGLNSHVLHGRAAEMKHRLIGLTGHAGSGKSAAAEYLMGAYGYQRVKLAGGLKDMLRAIGLTESELEGDLKESPSDLLCGKSPRHAMQTLGTEWGRELIGADLWTDTFTRKASGLLEQGFNVVCDDVRFLNEASTIWHLGGTVVLIERGGLQGSVHVSESQRVPSDWTVQNDGTLGNLRRGIDSVLLRISDKVA